MPEQPQYQIGELILALRRQGCANDAVTGVGGHAVPEITDVCGDERGIAMLTQNSRYGFVLDNRSGSEFAHRKDLSSIPCQQRPHHSPLVEVLIQDNHAAWREQRSASAFAANRIASCIAWRDTEG